MKQNNWTLNIKCKTLKFLEENFGEKFFNISLVQWLLIGKIITIVNESRKQNNHDNGDDDNNNK